MLMTLSVHNFALFEKLAVDFAPGFNVLTGETGAGKSILIDAFNIALGGKASADYIRSGADFFVVQAVFDIKENKEVQALLEEFALDFSEGELILSRKVTAAGKNTTTVNGMRVPVGTLKTLGDRLVDVHGQYENQQLLKPETYLKLLDNFLSKEGQVVLKEYKSKFALYKNLLQQLEANKKNAVERERMLDILAWEIEEIETAGLQPGEDTALEEQSKKLANFEKINASLAQAYSIFEGENSKYGNILTALHEAKRQLNFVAEFEEDFNQLAEKVEGIEYELAEIKTFLAGKLETFEPGEVDLETVEQRLDIIYKLKKKYGSRIEEILQYLEQAREQQSQLLNIEGNTEKLTQQQNQLVPELTTLAQRLSKFREASGKVFSKGVEKHIHDLAMQQAEFLVELKKKENLGENGQDEIAFLFSANAGQPARSLNKVASGGELSRVALAIKTVLLGREGLPTMVFDEVDTGVGGATAQRMAEKLALLACQKQVLCITHLPQIACMADQHINIEKKQAREKTWIEIKVLAGKDRVAELTRMIAGDDNSEVAQENARQMLEKAGQRKKALRANCSI